MAFESPFAHEGVQKSQDNQTLSDEMPLIQ